MASKVTIHFEKLRFFAFHGLYESEKKAGNEFEMNLAVSFLKEEGIIHHLNETINYVALYNIVKEEMKLPRELLETFLTELAEKIKTCFPEVVQLKMNLYKLTVPIENFEGRIGVALEKEY